MQIGLKLWSTNLSNYANEAMRLYESGYYTYLELYVVPNSLDTLSGWKKLNIPYTLHCPHSAHGFNLAKSELKNSNQQIFNEVRKFADELNVDYIIIHGGLDGNAKETAEQLKGLNEPRALIENKPYKSTPKVVENKICIGYNKEEIDLIKNESNCGFCLDFNHAICAANSFKINYISYIEDLMELKPQMFHLADMPDANSEFDSHLHLGQGKLELEKLAKFLSVDAKVSLETAKNSKTSLEDFIDDCKFIKRNILLTT